MENIIEGDNPYNGNVGVEYDLWEELYAKGNYRIHKWIEC